MIRTFDFIAFFRGHKKDREKLLTMMACDHDIDYDHGGWHLHFDVARQWLQITNNGRDESLSRKFIPAEMSFKTLEALVYGGTPEELEIRYLEE